MAVYCTHMPWKEGRVVPPEGKETILPVILLRCPVRLTFEVSRKRGGRHRMNSSYTFPFGVVGVGCWAAGFELFAFDVSWLM